MDWFSFNGKFFREGTPVVSAGSRGLRFGDGIFETIRAVDGKLELVEAHFARLWKGLQTLRFRIPVHFTPEDLEKQILSVLIKNGHLQTARVRLTVFRGEGGLFDPVDHFPNLIIQSWALPADKHTWNSNGLVLGIYTLAKKAVDGLSNLKHNNFLTYSMAALHAKEQKWNDALVLNCHDRICDSCMANVFFVKNGAIYTPSLGEGCIAGVTRQYIIDKLRKLEYNIEQGSFTVEDLLAADEIFLSNSMYHMRWVQSLADRDFYNTLSAKINEQLFSTIP
jgi:branched-chain amino acid aminotransferase